MNVDHRDTLYRINAVKIATQNTGVHWVNTDVNINNSSYFMPSIIF